MPVMGTAPETTQSADTRMKRNRHAMLTRPLIAMIAALACCWLIRAEAAEPSAPGTDGNLVETRLRENLDFIQAKPWPLPEKSLSHADYMALLLLFKNEKVEEANRLILAYCGADREHEYVGKRVSNDRNEGLLRIYLMDRTRKLLTPEASKAIEDYAWDLLTKYSRGISKAIVDQATLTTFLIPNNGQTNRWRRYTLALQVVRKAKQYGPNFKLDGVPINSHCLAWDKFWLHFFQTFPKEGTDMDIAHPASYGQCTVGVMYDLYDLADNTEVRRLAGNFLTLFWAEVASEFQPSTSERGGMATTRWPHDKFYQPFWARDLLYCYHWHENKPASTFLGNVLFLTSGYRPPAIVSAIARNQDRGSYLVTSRRPGWIGYVGVENSVIYDPYVHPVILFDKHGDSHFRRDVYYTPDYALGTMSTDPERNYISELILTPMMGATFASAAQDRVTVTGTGYYSVRAINGITGAAVSIMARDPNAEFGQGRFKSDGTKVFISNGKLWDNRVEDKSGWFFTRADNAYVAIRAAAQGYRVTDTTYVWLDRESVNRRMATVPERDGYFLELNDLWSPIVIQMGRAADYKGFESFCAAVKANRFEYQEGKLTYSSLAKDTYEVWAKGAQLPRINGTTVNLNPAKTFDSPFLSMEHGSSKAVIRYPGHKELVLGFNSN